MDLSAESQEQAPQRLSGIVRNVQHETVLVVRNAITYGDAAFLSEDELHIAPRSLDPDLRWSRVTPIFGRSGLLEPGEPP